MSIIDIDFVEFYVSNAKQASFYYSHLFNLSPCAYAGLETGVHDHATHVLEQDEIALAFTSSVQSIDHKKKTNSHQNDITMETDPIASQVARHGDFVKNVAFYVDNVEKLYQRAIEHGAESIQKPIKKPILNKNIKSDSNFIEIAEIKPPFADWKHTLINRTSCRYHERRHPEWNPIHSNLNNSNNNHNNNNNNNNNNSNNNQLLHHVDHIAMAIEQGTLHNIMAWYQSCLGFERFQSSDDDDQKDGVVVNTGTTGLKTMVMAPPSKRFKFVFVEPIMGEKKSQIQEFLDFHRGPGIAHMALSTHRIVDAVASFRNRGASFISVPSTYYTSWQQRDGYDDIHESWDDLRREEILVDGYRSNNNNSNNNNIENNLNHDNNLNNIENNSNNNQFRYLMQTFTRPLSDRPTFYIEIIQRVGADGFGKGNITALALAIEKLQEQRGNL